MIASDEVNASDHGEAAGWLGTQLRRIILRIVLHLIFGVALVWFTRDFNAAVLGDLAPATDLRGFEDAALGLSLSVIPLFWLPERLEAPSHIFGYLLYLLIYLSFCTVGLQSIGLPILELLPFMGVCCACCIVMFRAPANQAPIPREGVSNKVIVYCCIATALALVALAIVRIGVDFNPLAIDDVYTLREYRRFQFASEGLWYWGYLLPPLSQVIAPVVVCMALVSRRYGLLFVGAAIAYAAYQTSSEKSAAGSALICVVAFYSWRTPFRTSYAFSPTRILLTMFALLIGTAVFEAIEDDPSHLLSQLTIGRVFVIPGIISAYWVDYFSSNPFGGFAGPGLLGLLFGREQVYAIPLSYVIGLQYFANELINANVNLWADSFGQFGIVGVMMASTIAVVTLRILDRLSVDRDRALILPLCVPLTFSLSNGSITSVILTNGLWLLAVVIFFLPRLGAPSLGGTDIANSEQLVNSSVS